MNALEQAAKQAHEALYQAARDVLPREQPVPPTSALWGQLLPHQLATLGDILGTDMTGQFVSYMMRKEGM